MLPADRPRTFDARFCLEGHLREKPGKRNSGGGEFATFPNSFQNQIPKSLLSSRIWPKSLLAFSLFYGQLPLN